MGDIFLSYGSYPPTFVSDDVDDYDEFKLTLW